MPSTELAYLFRAYFADGTTFDQTPADKARLKHPRKGSGSAFTDLLYLIERKRARKQLVAFALCDLQMQPLVAVHLADGHFELGGNEFWAGQDARGVLDIEQRRLNYYREVMQIASADVADGKPSGAWRYETRVCYFVGWQVTLDGRNVQHIIGIDGPPAS